MVKTNQTRRNKSKNITGRIYKCSKIPPLSLPGVISKGIDRRKSLPGSSSKSIARRRVLSFSGKAPTLSSQTCLSILENLKANVVPVYPKCKAVKGKPVQPEKIKHVKPIFVAIKCTAHKNIPSLEILLDNLKIEKSADATPPIPIRKQDTMGGIPELSI